MKGKSRKVNKNTSIFVHIFFIVYGMACLIPFLIVVSASLTNEMDLVENGYSILPRAIDFQAYQYLFAAPKTILNAYKVTFIVTISGTFISLVVVSMLAYGLARRVGTLMGKVLTYYIYLPCLFGGGLTASYIINSRYLHLTDNLLVLILPGCVGVFNVFMIRTFITQQPLSLFEAAKMDGASEFLIYYRIALPLAKPALATVGFNVALGNWNSWYNSMIYIRDDDKVTLQHLLQRMMMSLSDILRELKSGMGSAVTLADLPSENLRMAMLVVAIGPMMFLFPFFQKYFVKGMVVGAVKG